jgi:hypothetical protein
MPLYKVTERSEGDFRIKMKKNSERPENGGNSECGTGNAEWRPVLK